MNQFKKAFWVIVLAALVGPTASAQKVVATSVRQITTDTSGHTWLLGFSYQMANLTPKGWMIHPSGFRVRYASVAPNGTLYVIGYDDRIYREAGKKFGLVDNAYQARRVVADGKGTLWIIGLTDEIFSLRNGRWTEHPGDFRAKEIALDRTGKPYLIGTDNRVYVSTGTGWKLLAENSPKAQKMAFDNRNRLWLIDSSNELQGELKPRQWSRYPGRRSRDIAFGKGQAMYFIGYWNNRLYREMLSF